MELLPLGPVLFIDTAGIDDVGALGELRAARTLQVFERTDLGVLVATAGEWGDYEDMILEEFAAREIPHRGRVQQDRPGQSAVRPRGTPARGWREGRADGGLAGARRARLSPSRDLYCAYISYFYYKISTNIIIHQYLSGIVVELTYNYYDAR